MAEHGVYLEGYKELVRKLRPVDPLVARPWKEAMEDLAQTGAKAAQQAAPVGHTSTPAHVITRGKNKDKRVGAHKAGLLREKTYFRLMKGPFPKWAAIRSRAKRRGYDYPRLLEYSPKHGHAGWFSRALGPVEARAPAALSRAADQIERNWNN